MMFVVVPAVIFAIVRTTGKFGSRRRVTIDWRASTISAAMGIGSTAMCGLEAWPPAPRTVIWTVPLPANIGPGRTWIVPLR